jgi:hypothetical protein
MKNFYALSCKYNTTEVSVSTSWIPVISLYVYRCIPVWLLGNGYVKKSPHQEYRRRSRRNVGRVVSYAMCVVSKESR